MCVVVSQQNADENPPEELVDIHFALVRLMRADELGHLSIRTFIFGFGWSPEELIELFKVDLLAAPRAIESPNEQAVPMDVRDRGNFNLDDLVCGQENPSRVCRQILEFDQVFQFRGRKLRDVRAWLAALGGTELLAFLHRKQF